MTNYNERLDEIERHFRAAWKQTQHKTVQVPAYGLAWQEAKQAITSLIKELVAEAKPEIPVATSWQQGIEKKAFEDAIRVYEYKLLKALEEL